MPPVFISKKQRAEMRKRRKKKRLREGEGGCSDAGRSEDAAAAAPKNGIHVEGISSRQGQGKRDGKAAEDGNEAVVDSNRQSSSVHGRHAVRIPDGLTGKEARKFRKDARRKARAGGRDPSLIEFVSSDGKPCLNDEKSAAPSAQLHHESSAAAGTKRAIPSSSSTGEDEPDGGDESGPRGKKKRRKGPPPKAFPRINDLLAAHEEAKKKQKELESRTPVPPEERERYVALDCEMVGIGPGGKQSALARASLVGWDGTVLLDTFVRVPDRVTDFRTFVSGVRARDIKATNDAAMELHECRRRVGELLKGKVLVGHALKNDLSALMLDHDRADIRDTARYRPFMRPSGRGGGKMRPRKLRDLVKDHLDLEIQVDGEAHCSIDDARATMDLFKFAKDRWDKELQKKDGGKKKVRAKRGV